MKGFKAKIKIPGVLIIDTPGHEVFSNLRLRGGSVADIAILVIDILKGVERQTIECIEILKSRKTPFLVAANKIDRIPGWIPHEGASFLESYAKQPPAVRAKLDELIYKLMGELSQFSFSSERFDRVRDFTRTVAIVPTSAVTGEGIPELLAVLCGLVQQFMVSRLKMSEGAGRGVVLEVREEPGLGHTIDVILYDGILRRGDLIVVGGLKAPITTRVRALLLPKPLHEMRDPEDRFLSVESVAAAAGVKVVAQGLDDALAGAPVVAVWDEEQLGSVLKEVSEEVGALRFSRDVDGVVLKADTLGSLEALTDYLRREGIPVRLADIGPVIKRDVVEASLVKSKSPEHAAVLAFNVKVTPEAEAEARSHGVKIFASNIVYHVVEEYQKWVKKLQEEMKRKELSQLIWPGKIRILPGFIFRRSEPAIVGVEVLAGKIKPGYPLVREDGARVGSIMQIQDRGQSIQEAIQGMKVAISIKGHIMVGRHIDEGDLLYVAVPEQHARTLVTKYRSELNTDELEVLRDLSRKFKWLLAI